MDDLETSTEGMDRRYLWRASKRSRRVHIEDTATGRAYCQAENCSGGKPFDGRGTGIPAGRRVCGNCIDLAGQNETDYREPSLAVLMGERLAETEPGLFVGTGAPKPWKRARPTRRSKGGRPKRGIKHSRPFNDDLPW